jgi:quinol monooxygenase YgiN
VSKEAHVIALCKASPGMEAATRSVLEQLVEPTLKEPGCIRYALHVNLDDPSEFYFIETWADHAALDQHYTTPETAALVQKLDVLLRKGDHHQLDPIGLTARFAAMPRANDPV